MSHAASHAALDKLRTRWEQEGFVRKGKQYLARVVPQGLQLVVLGLPGTWRTAVSVGYGVWHAAFERRLTGDPTPWPRKRFRMPEEKRWHATVGLPELSGRASDNHLDSLIVETVWASWGAAERWLEQHTNLETLAELSMEAGRRGDYTPWRHYRTAALCFLELGQPERVPELMAAGDVTAADLAPPAAPPPKPVPRDSIWYASQLGGEWLKTRELQVALDKTSRLLSMTSFERWNEAELKVHVAPSPELERVAEQMGQGEAETKWDRHHQLFDRDKLGELGIEVDSILADAITRFGSPQLRRWCSAWRGDWTGSRFYFLWTRNDLALPDDWVAFCDEHREVTLHERARIELDLRSPPLVLLDAKTRVPLPFQGDAHCPPSDNMPSWPSHATVALHLPACKLDLRARLPFPKPDAAFRRYFDSMSKAVGYKLSPKHLRLLAINKQGTRAYDRKLDLPA